uniref:Metalloendopeptidase n=1 Tax=Callorhinchus milii TaxID=7868 RepID=A0A4W3HYC3_CALMI
MRHCIRCQDYRYPFPTDEETRSSISQGFGDFEKFTCVRFVPRSDEEDFISIQPLQGCYSSVGRVGGMQLLSLKRQCLKKGKGVVEHELMHSLGFWHEHTRSDRDKFIKIEWKNVWPGYEHNFLKKPTNNLKSKYDYGSILHYSRSAFSKNGHPTLKPLLDTHAIIGQRIRLSEMDLLKVNRLYNCTADDLFLNDDSSQLENEQSKETGEMVKTHSTIQTPTNQTSADLVTPSVHQQSQITTGAPESFGATISTVAETSVTWENLSSPASDNTSSVSLFMQPTLEVSGHQSDLPLGTLVPMRFPDPLLIPTQVPLVQSELASVAVMKRLTTDLVTQQSLTQTTALSLGQKKALMPESKRPTTCSKVLVRQLVTEALVMPSQSHKATSWAEVLPGHLRILTHSQAEVPTSSPSTTIESPTVLTAKNHQSVSLSHSKQPATHLQALGGVSATPILRDDNQTRTLTLSPPTPTQHTNTQPLLIHSQTSEYAQSELMPTVPSAIPAAGMITSTDTVPSASQPELRNLPSQTFRPAHSETSALLPSTHTEVPSMSPPLTTAHPQSNLSSVSGPAQVYNTPSLHDVTSAAQIESRAAVSQAALFQTHNLNSWFSLVLSLQSPRSVENQVAPVLPNRPEILVSWLSPAGHFITETLIPTSLALTGTSTTQSLVPTSLVPTCLPPSEACIAESPTVTSLPPAKPSLTEPLALTSLSLLQSSITRTMGANSFHPVESSVTETPVPTSLSPDVSPIAKILVPTYLPHAEASIADVQIETSLPPAETSTTETPVPTSLVSDGPSSVDVLLPIDISPAVPSPADTLVENSQPPSEPSIVENLVPTNLMSNGPSTADVLMPTDLPPTASSTAHTLALPSLSHIDHSIAESLIVTALPPAQPSITQLLALTSRPPTRSSIAETLLETRLPLAKPSIAETLLLTYSPPLSASSDTATLSLMWLVHWRKLYKCLDPGPLHGVAVTSPGRAMQPDSPRELLCDFEHGFCDWEQSTRDDFDWTRCRYHTSSWETGPNGDHTKGQCKRKGGRYLYIEASYPQQSGDRAALISPVIRGPACLLFWYNMYGKHMGSLNVYSKYESAADWFRLWSTTGNQGRKWHRAQIDIRENQETFQVIIEGVLGLSYQSDIAIDDVQIYTDSCAEHRKLHNAQCDLLLNTHK